MDKYMKRYYKARQHGGRNTAARIADSVALHCIFVAACYLWFQSNIQDRFFSLLLTSVTSVLLFMALRIWKSLAFEKFAAKEKARLMDKALREKLMLIDEKSYMGICKEIAAKQDKADDAFLDAASLFSIRQFAPVDEDALLKAYHYAVKENAQKLVLCTLPPCTLKAAALMQRLPMPIEHIKGERILCEAHKKQELMVSDEEIENYIREEEAARKIKKQNMQNNAFSKDRAKKYFLSAAVLLLASFVTNYALYYRLLSGLCVSLAMTSMFLNASRFRANEQ